MQTTTEIETIVKLEFTIEKYGIHNVAVATEGNALHVRCIVDGYTETARWEQWKCTTCGHEADNNPSRDGDKYDNHTYFHGHKATR